jgi:carboxyl-terminal processing protease
MLPAANRGASMNVNFPDVCLTPAGIAVVPIPYPNLAPHAMALGFSPNVMISGMNAMSMIAEIPMTMGDQPGVANPLLMETGMFIAGNPVVYVNMMPGICLCCPTAGNDFNAPLGAQLVPAVTNVFYTYAAPGAAGPGDRALAAGDLDALARELASVGREAGPPVEARMAAPGVGLLEIRVFSADVPARVFGAMKELEAAGMRELTIDLRDNPGGEATAFLELAGDFLEPGSVVATRVDGDGDETVYRSWQERPYRMPVTILVNRGTASAAELFAECLAAQGRAKVEGGPTYGKRTGQQVVIGVDGSPRAATVAGFRVAGRLSDVRAGQL